MRLNTKMEIMAYLGRSVKNRAGWRKVRREYTAALHYLSGGNRVWASSEALDAIDRARHLTVAEALELKRGAVRGGGGERFCHGAPGEGPVPRTGAEEEAGMTAGGVLSPLFAPSETPGLSDSGTAARRALTRLSDSY